MREHARALARSLLRGPPADTYSRQKEVPMRKLVLKTITVKTLDSDAALQAVAGGAGRPRRPSAPPFRCIPDTNSGKPE
jgi:hypothetical protein